jgi:predicted metal-dependent hydrolase
MFQRLKSRFKLILILPALLSFNAIKIFVSKEVILMNLTPEKWLEKFEKEGNADELFLIIHGKEYTPRQIASMDYVFWKQVVKSV